MTAVKQTIELQKTLNKLQALLKDGADFTMTRWMFEWDETKSSMHNVEQAHKEFEALIELQNYGCITLRVEDNPLHMLSERMVESPNFFDYTPLEKGNHLKGYKKFRASNDYLISAIKVVRPESDAAWSGYDWAVWITGFDKEKFERFKHKGATTQVSIIKKQYRLYLSSADTELCIHTFTEGSPLEKVFDYLYSHQDSEVDTKRVEFETNGYKSPRNLSEDLRAMGFNKLLKKHFFPVCTSDRARFTAKAEINNADLQAIHTELKTDSKSLS